MNNPIPDETENINCNGSEEKTKSYLNLIFFFCMLLTAEPLFAQSNSDSNTVKVVVANQEEENLNVFQQWITWNNCRSLAINHLTSQR